MKRVSNIVINLSLLFVSIFSGLIIAEVLIRWSLNFKYERKETFNGIRINPYPGLAYDMEPCPLCNIRINSWGLRGKEIVNDKTSDTVRITVIGDSATFGVLITDDEDTIPGRLEILLNERPPIKGKRFEVINGGVPGYDIQEIYLNYIYKIRYLKSDIVIYNFFPNDFLNSKFTVEKIDGKPMLVRYVNANMPGLQIVGLIPEKINIFLNENSMLYRYTLFYISQLFLPDVSDSAHLDRYQQGNIKYLYMLIDEIRRDRAIPVISSEIYSFCANCKEPLEDSGCDLSKGCSGAYYTIKLVEKEARRLGIPYVNLSERLTGMNLEDVMIDKRAHYTGKANIIMAERLYEFLSDLLQK